METAGMALDQHLALEGIPLRRIAAGVKQIGIAAEDFAIPEHDHAAALADAPILQADMDRIQCVFHGAVGCDTRHSEVGTSLCQSAPHSVNAAGWLPSRILLVALQQFDRDTLRAPDKADADAR